jgi:hypothetical protein
VSSLKGAPELRARLTAIKGVFKPVARQWAKDDVILSRASVPVKTGKLRRSIRVTSVTAKKARVGGFYTAYFIDAGPKPHAIAAKGVKGRLIFQAEGRTIFARKVHSRGYRARPFRQRAAEEALRRNPLAVSIIKLWNDAA